MPLKSSSPDPRKSFESEVTNLLNGITSALNAMRRQVQGLQEDVKGLQAGQERLQAGQEMLQAGQEMLQAGHERLQAGHERLESDVQGLRADVHGLQHDVQELQAGQERLEQGQEELKEELILAKKDFFKLGQETKASYLSVDAKLDQLGKARRDDTVDSSTSEYLLNTRIHVLKASVQDVEQRVSGRIKELREKVLDMNSCHCPRSDGDSVESGRVTVESSHTFGVETSLSIQ